MAKMVKVQVHRSSGMPMMRVIDPAHEKEIEASEYCDVVEVAESDADRMMAPVEEDMAAERTGIQRLGAEDRI